MVGGYLFEVLFFCYFSQYTRSFMRNVYYLVLVGDLRNISLFESSVKLFLFVLQFG